MVEQCPKCKSFICHQYSDIFVCFDCGYKEGEHKAYKPISTSYRAPDSHNDLEGGEDEDE